MISRECRKGFTFWFVAFNIVVVLIIICFMSSNRQKFFEAFRQNSKLKETEVQQEITILNTKLSNVQNLEKLTPNVKSVKVDVQKQETAINYNTTKVQSSAKLILLWRPLYQLERTFTRAFKKYCPLLPCTLSSNRRLLSRADAVFVEVEGLQNFPKKGKMGQVWIYVDLESPSYMRNGLLKWDNFFNWTMTYRRDSDFVLKYAYLRNMKTAWSNIDGLMTNKTKHMSWLVSRCHTPGKREEYINILKRHFRVDVFGKCGKKICNKLTGCEYDYIKRYKFYLAAENSNCRDYITEKAVRPLEVSTLPVVKGGSNYSLYVPQNSVINAKDFSSPKSLADYLKTVNNDDKLYKSFFAWQKHSFDSDVPGYNVFCDLCRKLHIPDKYQRLYKSIHDWWRGNEENAGEYFCEKEELVRL